MGTDSDGVFEVEVEPGDRPYYVGYYQAPETVFETVSIQNVTAEEVDYYEELEGDLPADVFPRDGSVDMYGIDEVAATEDTDIGTVTVPAGHVVNVTVVDDGDPVEGAPVGYQHTDTDTGGVATVTTKTDENGTPLLARDGGLELNGEVAVMAASEFGEEPNIKSVDVTATEDVVIDLSTDDEPRDDVVIEPYFEIEGQIGWQVGDEIEFDASDAAAFDGDEEIEFDSITWDFGDGNTTVVDDPAETPLVTHTYAESGWYAASATFEASGVEETYTRELQVSEAITLTAEPTTAEVNVTEVTFTVEGAENDDHLFGYAWDVTGDGQPEQVTDADEPTYTHTYSELGEFEATVQLQSEMNPAQETVTVDVVDTTDPVARLDAPANAAVDQTVTADASESTDNHRIADYTWVLTDEDGSVVFSTTTDTPAYEFSVPHRGEYELEVTVTDESGNTDATSQSLSISDDTDLAIDLDVDDEQNIRDGVNADAEVTNLGSRTVDDSFAVELIANGTTYEGEFQTTDLEKEIDEELSQDESTTVTFDLSEWVQNHRIIGDLDLRVEADPADNISETTLENNVDAATIEVVYAEFNASTHASEVTHGENTTLRSYVANAGTATSEETVASVTVTDEDNNTVFENESVTVDALDPGERQRNRFDEPLGPGNYTLTVEVIDDLFPGESETEFAVEPYELTVDENRTSVPSDVNRGQNFTAVFGYEANTNAEVNATLELPEELEFVDGDDPETKTVTVRPRAGITNVVAYDLTAVEASEDPVDLDFTVEDTLELDVEDNTTARTNISIVTETVTNETAISYDGTEDTVTSTIGVYGDEVSEGHNVSIAVQGGPEGRTLQGLEYLVNYPYGCVEQTTSAFLGALNTHQYYEDRDDGDIDPDRQQVIDGSIEEGVDRLAPGGIREQQDDGSWNQWGSSWQSGQSYFSVLALYGLSQVDNDDKYGPENEERLDDVEFDDAVEWLAADDNWAGTDGYLNDDASAIGFAVISLEEAAESERTSEESAELIDETYADAADELLEIQDDDSPTWNDENHRSTAFAVYGLQIVLDAEAYEDDEQRQEIENAVEDGAAWLADNQNEDGSWDPYHQSPWYNNEGDISKSTAISMLALDAADEVEYGAEVQAGVDYLIDVYETDGSWGYPRATNMALTALTELTNENADRTMEVTLEGSADVVSEISVDADDPQASEEITGELAQLREDNDELNDVTVSVTDSSEDGSGTVIVAVQTTQEVHEDAIGGEN
ncbi:PKD domain-containing protein [Natrarchaeobius oligotrophus]|uniref:PKD domain-containing protein n=1 Tax=Natrarchaeobius oligotrophus TaxID=3455743 RepID=UPI001FB3C6FD|nr:PKD domain-containing protein [Natrarchaeobius chitinivorans]